MDDVFGEVMLAIGDEDFLALDTVGAIAHRLGACAHRSQVGTCLGLGEVHGAGPFTADHLRQVGLFQVGRAAQLDGLDSATGEHRA
ncbi:hypothetical protein D3C80_1447890 [compost metagenome]